MLVVRHHGDSIEGINSEDQIFSLIIDGLLFSLLIPIIKINIMYYYNSQNMNL